MVECRCATCVPPIIVYTHFPVPPLLCGERVGLVTRLFHLVRVVEMLGTDVVWVCSKDFTLTCCGRWRG